MPYTVRSSEKLRKIASDYETKAMLYLMNFREDSSQIHYFVVDFFNDVTGMDRMAGKLWDVQSKASKSATAKAIGRELVTLFKNYVSEFEFTEYVLFLGAVPDTFRINGNLNISPDIDLTRRCFMVGKYNVITLCGSTRFKDEFMEAQKRLTLEGNIVISVGLFGHSGDNEVWENMDEGTLTKTKEMLDDMHKRKIDMADEIYVINVGGYIGDSTRSEIEYAKATGKPVRYLEDIE